MIHLPWRNIPLYLWFNMYLQVLSFTHPTSFHSAETYESLLQCLRMEDDKVAEAAIQIFRNTGHKIETDLPQIRSWVCFFTCCFSYPDFWLLVVNSEYCPWSYITALWIWTAYLPSFCILSQSFCLFIFKFPVPTLFIYLRCYLLLKVLL